MTYDNISKIIKDIKDYPYNPGKIQRAVLEHLSHVTEGKVTYVNPTNPFGFDLESAAVLTAGFCSYDFDLTRKQYPSAAMTNEDLYAHMCDKDYIGRFAIPTSAKFNFLMRVDEVTARMVYDPNIDAKKVVIPRNSFITVAGITFTLEYPIEIRELPHGGLQILINSEIKSPVQILKTNMVDFDVKKQLDRFPHGQEIDWLQFQLDILQIKVESYDYPTSRAEAFNKKIDVSDQYYYCRVFYQDNNSNWVEMQTTHSPDVYDVATPTAVLKVLNKTLQVTIPQVYSDLGYLDAKIRVDVYETKGSLDVDLNSYLPSEYTTVWRAFDSKRDINQYTTPLGRLPSLSVYSSDIVSGGRSALSFRELRERVIENSIGIRNIPTSNIQIETHLEDEGFKIVRNIDLVTNRAYLASRSLPSPENDRLITPAAASIETLNTTLDLLVSTGYVYQNYKSITISPDAVYESKNGILHVVPKSQVNSILALPVDERIKTINNRNLYKSPFHYVIDMKEKVFDLRAYYLDHPKADNKSFVDANDTTALLQVTVMNYQIERVKNGYKLTIMTKSDSSFDQLSDDRVFVQLAFIPPNEIEHAYVNGKYLGREGEHRLFEFLLETNYNITKENYIEFTNFKMYNNDRRIVQCNLQNEFDIIFSTNEPLSRGWRHSPIDNKLGKFILPPDTKAIVNERIRLTLGYNLDSLWKRCRTMAGSERYDVYDRDIYATYETDVYDIDPLRGSAVVVKPNGDIEYKIKHRKGDIRQDSQGNPIIKHRKGDVIFTNGLPTLVDNRKIVVQLDIMLIEWAYYLADHPIIKSYRQNMIDVYVDWITDSLKSINERVLEQTKIFFYPRATLGNIDVMYNDGITTRINAAQRLTVDLVVRPQVYSNIELRREITKSTVRVINQLLNDGLISTNEILSALTKEYSYDVIGVDIHGLGNNDRIITMTILDDSKRCSLKKRLIIESNNTIFIEEDVTVNFIEHLRK